jgi:CDP-2,3-bis-(O-geranylgeranyl)-sn-glycerol synthase
MSDLVLLLLLLIANGSPILARHVFRHRLAAPVDCGYALADGRRLFGPAKTWRGMVAAVLTTSVAAALLGPSWSIGALIGLFAMLGDLLSSFVKRRSGIAAGGMAPGLDHLPESLLPLLVCRPLLGLSWLEVLLLSLAFMAANLVLSRLFYHLGVREHPY